MPDIASLEAQAVTALEARQEAVRRSTKASAPARRAPCSAAGPRRSADRLPGQDYLAVRTGRAAGAGVAGAFRRSELCALQVDDLAEDLGWGKGCGGVRRRSPRLFCHGATVLTLLTGRGPPPTAELPSSVCDYRVGRCMGV